MPAYEPIELMICAAARLLEDGSTVTVGTGAPCAAAMLAQRTCSPNLAIFFEAGGAMPILPTMPVSVGDSRTFHRAIMATSMCEIMAACQRGMMDYTVLGGAQIDPYGNLNSTHIGADHGKPKVRFPGSGGANDLGALCWRTLIMMVQDPRRFVEKIDFLTTPGYLNGPGAREAAGLPAGTGPYKVITNLAVLGFDEKSKRMKVESLHPEIAPAKIGESTGFELPVPLDVHRTDPPTGSELRILRDEVDPYGYIIGRKRS